jgi:hypothetical protein
MIVVSTEIAKTTKTLNYFQATCSLLNELSVRAEVLTYE